MGEKDITLGSSSVKLVTRRWVSANETEQRYRMMRTIGKEVTVLKAGCCHDLLDGKLSASTTGAAAAACRPAGLSAVNVEAILEL